MIANKYINRVVQKGGMPGIPGCVEHDSMIWEAIQKTKEEKGNLQVIWLELANTYGSVSHQLLWQALKTFHIPSGITVMLKEYFSGFSLCFSTMMFRTEWIDLQVGVAMGCTISLIQFIMAMQVILDGERYCARTETQQ